MGSTRMYERASFTDQASGLLAACREWVEVMMARQVREMAGQDPGLLRDLHRRHGPGYRVVPKYDPEVVKERFGRMQKAYGECTEALARTVDGTRALMRDLDLAAAGGAAAAFDCTVHAARMRAIHGQALLFHLRAAQVLCLVQEIEEAVVFLHECEPDPCAVLPPVAEGLQVVAAYQALREDERQMAAAQPAQEKREEERQAPGQPAQEKREEPPPAEGGRRTTPPKAG
jgi:hypothetical protein